MKLKTFTFNPIQVNTYLLWDAQTLEAAVIDAGMSNEDEYDEFDRFITGNGLKLCLCLQTHSHFDHIYGLEHVQKTYGLRPLMHALDEPVYYAMPELTACFHIPFRATLPAPERYITDGECIPLGQLHLHVIHTPGHTPGGVSFHLPNKGILFSGDTLFRGSHGRTDLPGGDYDTEMQSIRERLLTLPVHTQVLPGHGPATWIADEKAFF